MTVGGRARWTWRATTVTVAGRSVTLTRKEFQVLALLAAAGGRCARAAGSSPRCGAAAGRGRTGRSTCTSRRCAPSSAAPSWWQTVRGVGYRLGAPDAGTERGSTPDHAEAGTNRPRSRRARAAAGDRAGRRRAASRSGSACRSPAPPRRPSRRGSSPAASPTRSTSPRSLQRPLTDATGADLDALLDRYEQVYGVSVHVVTADGAPFAPSAPAAPPAPLDATGSERLDAALAGRRSEPPAAADAVGRASRS